MSGAQHLAKLKQARDIAEKAEGAARELTEDERGEINRLFSEAKADRQTELDRAATRKALGEVEEMLKAEEADELNAEALNGAKAPGRENRKSTSPGARFVKSAEYTDFMQRNPGGLSSKANINMGQVAVGGMKALLTSGSGSGTDAGVFVPTQKLGLVPYPYVAPKLREVITNGTTSSDKIEYAQMVPTADGAGTVNGARGVKEAPAITGTAGVKPQSALSFRKASADVITVANWLPVTRRALSDAAQIRTMIDGFLSQNLEEEVERLILTGDKDTPVGEEEWDGILNTSGVQAQGFTADNVTTIRKAISKVTTKSGNVTAVLVSPELDEQLDLLKDSTGRYLGAGPWSTGPGTIWGRPRIVIPSLSGKKKFILGDFSTCVLWDREEATLTATDSHEDFFVRNLVAVLAEMRAAFGILNPSLLVAGTTQEGE